jgi:hypothetical protein
MYKNTSFPAEMVIRRGIMDERNLGCRAPKNRRKISPVSLTTNSQLLLIENAQSNDEL